jgi:hypothetical protein
LDPDEEAGSVRRIHLGDFCCEVWLQGCFGVPQRLVVVLLILIVVFVVTGVLFLVIARAGINSAVGRVRAVYGGR